MNRLFIAIAIITIVNSCADWEIKTEIPDSGALNTERVILVEDFTGASCPNCPAGAIEIENILDKFPDNVVVLGIHSRFLADPVKAGEPNLITTDANNIEKLMGNWIGKPEAAINRRLHTGANIRIARPDIWINFIDQELKRDLEARIKIEKTYDELSRELKVKITATAATDLNFPIYLHVALSESEIFTTQKTTTGIIENYEQKHALRKLLTDVSGELLAEKLLKENSVSKEYQFILPPETNQLWKANSMSIVAFISKDAAEKTIIQAGELKLK
ncbi:MAG: Omp28-related outer membrane protein [Saprospiraceae bacterium]|nr:Omp28-related outer membrane protein [Saprospiraceae bacterium]